VKALSGKALGQARRQWRSKPEAVAAGKRDARIIGKSVNASQ